MFRSSLTRPSDRVDEGVSDYSSVTRVGGCGRARYRPRPWVCFAAEAGEAPGRRLPGVTEPWRVTM